MSDQLTPLGEFLSKAEVPASVTPGVVTPETPQLQIDPNKVKAIAISVGLALLATIGGATTLVSLAKDRDLAGIVAFMQSSDSVTFFGGITTLFGLGAIALRTFRRKTREIYLGYHVRNRIAVLTKPINPPKPPIA